MELLEYLRIQMGCMFISDLRGCGRFRALCNVLEQMDVWQYDMKEWNEALSYMTCEQVSFANQEELVQYVQRKAKKE